MNTIFVQIASYRDSELLPTIRDCIAKASFPDLLRFGICWQHAPEDTWDQLDDYINDPRFRIMDVKWQDSKGLGWARQRTQTLWQDEKFTLQLDSHHRFIQGWDTELIEMMAMTGSAKPILTSYAAPYNPGEPLDKPGPYKMVGTTFSSYGTILFYPHLIPTPEIYTKPIPARFVSGHFFFTLGQHCKEYKYDPEIYFAGDEISLSIRSFTLGYDIFHPHKHVVWHQYIRAQSKKHWDDFNATSKQQGKTSDAWHELDEVSKKRLRQMLREEDNHQHLGEYTLGMVRSHADYEKYAGISFRHRKLHPNTMNGIAPPVGLTPEEWLVGNQSYSLPLTIPREWGSSILCILDKTGNELYRQQVTPSQAITTVEFSASSIPDRWTFNNNTVILGKTSDAVDPKPQIESFTEVSSSPVSNPPIETSSPTSPIDSSPTSPIDSSPTSPIDSSPTESSSPTSPIDSSPIDSSPPIGSTSPTSPTDYSPTTPTTPIDSYSPIEYSSPVSNSSASSSYDPFMPQIPIQMHPIGYSILQKPIRQRVVISKINPWFR